MTTPTTTPVLTAPMSPTPMGWTREGEPVVLGGVLRRAALSGGMPSQGKSAVVWVAAHADHDTATTATVAVRDITVAGG